MDYPEALEYLNQHIAHGIKPGLERMEGLLDDMGRPEQGYPLIHVAGTNGKTSTSRFATLLLVAHGLNTGTYISPHLQRVEERLAINGRFATEEEFALAISDVAAYADLRVRNGYEPNTYFELTTAAAFAFFADQAVNAAVLEVGLGGRLDATNVVDAEVCVLTSIGIEHTKPFRAARLALEFKKDPRAVPLAAQIDGEEYPAAERVDLEVRQRALRLVVPEDHPYRG